MSRIDTPDESTTEAGAPDLAVCNGVVVVTDDTDDAGLRAAHAVAAELAGRAEASVLLFDRSGETWVDTPHPEGPLDLDDDRLAEREHLRQQLQALADRGVPATAWLSTVPTISDIEAALTRTGSDVVVVAASHQRKLLERALDGGSLAESIAIVIDRHPDLDAAVVEVAEDGTSTVIRSGSPSKPSDAPTPMGDAAPASAATTDAGTDEDHEPGQGEEVAQGADTLTGVLDLAAAEGFGEQFIAQEDGSVRCGRCGTSVPARTLTVGFTRRLEGASDPADLLLVVGSHCPSCGAGGVLTLGYGPNASDADLAVLPDVPME